ncbi:serine hydrolase domain-containing protein [Sinomicrobium weinanense]|uniref:Beta-lactamase family protein n=1 Tax=Sinomicrobium weinanense TaxID=2842200 RepID=A0A926JP77_9FLAO|nr:serine hydrolase domain-containing protein [Sinomicrobium weinanense]MBC9794942.1 beta-lactamase family protein [Sinomicrobium weinanense]MBU3125713.1 beta-lactamase family protein [Sinomicrobium weinanense]
MDSIFSNYDTIHTSGISIMVLKNGKILYNKSFGLSDIQNRHKASENTNYRIASVTKSFTAMAIMMLRDEGKLKLDDRLTEFFPDIPAYGKKVTIRQMLIHTSGLLGYAQLVRPERTDPLTDTDVLHLMERQDSTVFEPGSQFSYNNTAYVLLGLIVEKASGISFADFLRQRIFDPLGMTNSTLNSRTGVIANRAYGYNLKGDKLVKEDQNLYSYLLGDGGIYTSVSDFYKWDQVERTDKVSHLKRIKVSSVNEVFKIDSFLV